MHVVGMHPDDASVKHMSEDRYGHVNGSDHGQLTVQHQVKMAMSMWMEMMWMMSDDAVIHSNMHVFE